MAYLSTDPYAGSSGEQNPPSGGSMLPSGPPPGYHYEGIDWDQHLVPDDPNNPNTPANPWNKPVGGELPPGYSKSPGMPIMGSGQGNLIGPNPIVGGNAMTGSTAQLGPSATPQQILAFINQYAQAHGIQPGQSPAVTRQIVDALKAAGVNVDYETPDEYGRSAGLLFNGQPYKIVNGSDQWMFDSYLNAEGANPGTRPAGWNGGMGFGNGYGNMFGNSGAGGPFNPPDWNSLENYPGYQFAFEQGLRGIENRAAAKGTLLTGGTMKDIAGYLGGSLAMPAYNNYFNQAKQTHDTNFGDLISMGQLGKP